MADVTTTQVLEVRAPGAELTFPLPLSFDANMSVAGSAGAAAAISLALDAARPINLLAVYYSYSAAPTGGRLTIADDTPTTYFDQDVPAAGFGSVLFPVPMANIIGKKLVVTLAAPGGAVIGKLNIIPFKLL